MHLYNNILSTPVSPEITSKLNSEIIFYQLIYWFIPVVRSQAASVLRRRNMAVDQSLLSSDHHCWELIEPPEPYSAGASSQAFLQAG